MVTLPNANSGCNDSGVSFVTRSGRPKFRYSLDEKLKLLGCTEDDVQAFGNLFVTRVTDYAITRACSADPRGWTSGRGVITLGHLVRHLLGDLIPYRNPQWLAPRSWKHSTFIAIDVDYRKKKNDFDCRRRKLETALDSLGIPSKARLVVPTPSGGRHYYLFFAHPVDVEEVIDAFRIVGIRESKGRFEFFPSTTQGLRLPFGHVPGKSRDRTAWVRFIRAYRAGRFPLLHWHRLWTRANTIAERRLVRAGAAIPRRVAKGRESSRHAPPLRKGRSCTADKSCLAKYRALLAEPVKSPADIDELIDLGIIEPGTRLAVLKRITWNFVHVRRMTVAEAVSVITAWAYRSGAESSKDVQYDLKNGTRRVENQIAQLVKWHHERRNTCFQESKPRISEEELAAISKCTRHVPPDERITKARFLIEFLCFSKAHGRPVDQGWESSPSVRGIIRTWPGCSGMRYKALMDWAIATGILTLVREKRQSANGTGRARTYQLSLTVSDTSNATLTRDQASIRVARIADIVASQRTSTPSPHSASDTYDVCLPSPKEEASEIKETSDRTLDWVPKENSKEAKASTKFDKIHRSPPIGHGTFGNRSPEHDCNGIDRIDRFSESREDQHDVRSEYSRGPARSLATCPSQCGSIRTFVPIVCDSHSLSEPTCHPECADRGPPLVA